MLLSTAIRKYTILWIYSVTNIVTATMRYYFFFFNNTLWGEQMKTHITHKSPAKSFLLKYEWIFEFNNRRMIIIIVRTKPYIRSPFYSTTFLIYIFSVFNSNSNQTFIAAVRIYIEENYIHNIMQNFYYK